MNQFGDGDELLAVSVGKQRDRCLELGRLGLIERRVPLLLTETTFNQSAHGQTGILWRYVELSGQLLNGPNLVGSATHEKESFQLSYRLDPLEDELLNDVGQVWLAHPEFTISRAWGYASWSWARPK